MLAKHIQIIFDTYTMRKISTNAALLMEGYNGENASMNGNNTSNLNDQWIAWFRIGLGVDINITPVKPTYRDSQSRSCNYFTHSPICETSDQSFELSTQNSFVSA